ncbi:uncharacterized protein LOC131881196 isoform X2 [Tigriopus californicus]|uniref:uncharacterized protein LOC131881196 isoform X2 n=1 Tax=Tigriopus californicus TaxID=6832 RepID=UPI0027DAB06E|nr:uncharacterized protein LOC131881196 isoform X2 [Tigriopus californicus]
MIHSAKQQFAIAISFCLLFQTTCVHGDGQYLQSGQKINRTAPWQLQWPYHNHSRTARQAVVPTTATEFDDISAITAAVIGLTSSILIFDNLRVRFVDLRRRINEKTDRQNDLILRIFPVCEAILAARQEAPVPITGNTVDNTNKINAFIGHFDDVMTCDADVTL